MFLMVLVICPGCSLPLTHILLEMGTSSTATMTDEAGEDDEGMDGYLMVKSWWSHSSTGPACSMVLVSWITYIHKRS